MKLNTTKSIKDIAFLVMLVASGVAFAQSKPTPAPMDCRAQTVEKSRIELCRSKGEPQFGDVYVLRADGKVVLVVAAEYIHRVELELVTVASRIPVLQRLSGQGDKVTITGGCLPEGATGVTKAQVCNFYWGKHQVVKEERFEVR